MDTLSAEISLSTQQDIAVQADAKATFNSACGRMLHEIYAGPMHSLRLRGGPVFT